MRYQRGIVIIAVAHSTGFRRRGGSNEEWGRKSIIVEVAVLEIWPGISLTKDV